MIPSIHTPSFNPMQSSSPLTAADTSSSSSTSSSSGSTQSTASNTLGPDSFITLLTAQLQAQDPLSPMDPDQMVNELTSINTLEQITEVRSDMDTLVAALPSGQGGSGTGSGSSSSSISGAGSANSLIHAANATPPAAAKFNYQLNHQVNPQMNAISDSF